MSGQVNILGNVTYVTCDNPAPRNDTLRLAYKVTGGQLVGSMLVGNDCHLKLSFPYEYLAFPNGTNFQSAARDFVTGLLKLRFPGLLIIEVNFSDTN